MPIRRSYGRRIKAGCLTSNLVMPISRINGRGHINAGPPIHTGKVSSGRRGELFIDVHSSRQNCMELIDNAVVNVTHVTVGRVRTVHISQEP
jgi:hypothetical protein